MGLKKYDIDPANVAVAGLASGNASTGATVTLDGTLTSGGTFTSADGLAHRLILTDGTAHVQTTATYTITGTNSNGQAQTEAIAGPGSGGLVETVKYFLTVTGVAIASPVAGSTIDIGTVDEVLAPIYLLNWRSADPATVAIMGSSGTYVADIQETFDDISDRGIALADANWVDAQTDKSADLAASLTRHATAVRVGIDSYTDTAEFQFHINQLEYS